MIFQICVQRDVQPRMKMVQRQCHHGEKITMMQQRSTVDLRRRLTNFKMLVSHSMPAVLRQSV